MEFLKQKGKPHFYRKDETGKVLHVVVDTADDHCLINNLSDMPRNGERYLDGSTGYFEISDQVEFDIALQAAMVHLGLTARA